MSRSPLHRWLAALLSVALLAAPLTSVLGAAAGPAAPAAQAGHDHHDHGAPADADRAACDGQGGCAGFCCLDCTHCCPAFVALARPGERIASAPLIGVTPLSLRSFPVARDRPPRPV
jgi:hypothetical protein